MFLSGLPRGCQLALRVCCRSSGPSSPGPALPSSQAELRRPRRASQEAPAVAAAGATGPSTQPLEEQTRLWVHHDGHGVARQGQGPNRGQEGHCAAEPLWTSDSTSLSLSHRFQNHARPGPAAVGFFRSVASGQLRGERAALENQSTQMGGTGARPWDRAGGPQRPTLTRSTACSDHCGPDLPFPGARGSPGSVVVTKGGLERHAF